MLLPIHVAAGGLAMVLGTIALAANKGGTVHRRSGMLFVYAMLVMAVSASILSLLQGRANGNVMAGVLTAYFVGTALTTVRPVSSWTRRINAVALTVAVVLAAGCILGGLRLVNATGRDANGVPVQTAGVVSLVTGVLLVVAAAGDVRVMRFGMPRGGPRLARHLWRMCFALFIAAGSFFSLRERVATILPEPLTTGPMRALPIVALFGTTFYWLWRVRSRRTLPWRPIGSCLLVLVLAGLEAAAAQDLEAKRQEWAGRLAEPTPARRRGALREIPMWDPGLEGTYDLVFQALSDPDPETRIQAGELLVRTRRDPRALADLVELAGPASTDKNTRMKALMAIARVPEGALDALDTLRTYTADPEVGHVAQRTVEAVEGRQKWLETQAAIQRSPATEAPSPAPGPPPGPAAAPRRRPGGSLWLGFLAIGYGVLTIYLRAYQPERLGKLEAMKEQWGETAGTAIHWTAYTVLPILVGLVLMAVGMR